MHVDQLLLNAKQCAQHNTTMTFPRSWAQGRTAFGGISAAMLFTAMKEKVADDRPLRSITTHFVGPLLVDVPFSFDVEVLREGRSASQMVAKITQGGDIVVTQLASFGNERLSDIEVANHDRHQLRLPTELPPLPLIEGIAPDYLNNIDLRIDHGGMPYSAHTSTTIGGWMQFKQEPHVISDAHLICLVDAWPPTVLQMMKKPAPASTINWNLEFIHPHKEFTPDGWFAYQAITRQAANGYAHVEANIWDDAGDLVAISRQTVAIFG